MTDLGAFVAEAITIPCQQCGQPLARNQRRHGGKYCSRACSVSAQIEAAKVTRGNCEVCGTPLRKGQKAACSRECVGALNCQRSPNTGEFKERFRGLWLAVPELKTTQIAATLGVTPNVIVGLRSRMKLPTRGNPVKRREGGVKPPQIPRAPRVTLPALEPQQQGSLGRRPPQPAPKSEFAAELPRPPGGCQWTDCACRPWTFCEKPVYGRRAEDGSVHWSSWCKEHYSRAYQRRPEAA